MKLLQRIQDLVFKPKKTWVVNALAQAFGGSRSRLNAFKLVAFAATASFASRIFDLMPALGFLAWFGALCSIYLVYTGASVLIKCPPKRAATYTAVVVVVCGFLVMLLLSATASVVLPRNSGLLDEMVGAMKTGTAAENLPTQTSRSHAPCPPLQWSV